MEIQRVSWWFWLVLVGLAISFFGIVFLAPAERTLGEAIRYVYVHVAFTKAGMWGFYLSGILGMLIVLTGNSKLQSWTQIIAWVSLALFLCGGIVSVFAGFASWGGFPIDEPRNRTMFSALALSIIVLILNHWLPCIRIRGLLYIGLAAYIAWVIPNTPLVLHPGNAGGSSPSNAIRWAFFVLPIIVFLIGAWFVLFFGKLMNREEKGLNRR